MIRDRHGASARCRLAVCLPLAAVLCIAAALATAADGVVPPRNTGPAAQANSRVRQHRRGTVRIIRRTPQVMREDAARVPRGELFSTWSNRHLE